MTLWFPYAHFSEPAAPVEPLDVALHATFVKAVRPVEFPGAPRTPPRNPVDAPRAMPLSVATSSGPVRCDDSMAQPLLMRALGAGDAGAIRTLQCLGTLDRRSDALGLTAILSTHPPMRSVSIDAVGNAQEPRNSPWSRWTRCNGVTLPNHMSTSSREIDAGTPLRRARGTLCMQNPSVASPGDLADCAPGPAPGAGGEKR